MSRMDIAKFITAVIFFGLLYRCQRESNFGQVPAISIIEPSDDIHVTQDSMIYFLVSVSDTDGDIIVVKFYRNEILLHTDFDPPYEFNWRHMIAFSSEHQIIATATDENGLTSSDTSIISFLDYREKFYGDFHFTTHSRLRWSGLPVKYDTIYHSGKIKIFSLRDSYGDVYGYGGDELENPSQKIIIEFKPNRILTPMITPEGIFLEREFYHYLHQGRFHGLDSVFFTKKDGSPGVSFNDKVIGVRTN